MRICNTLFNVTLQQICFLLSINCIERLYAVFNLINRFLPAKAIPIVSECISAPLMKKKTIQLMGRLYIKFEK